MNKSFPKEQHLRTAGEFQRVYLARRRLYGHYYTLNYLKNDKGHARIGIVTSKRNARKAVARNRVRRIVREAFRHYQASLGAVDVVVIAKPPSAEGSKQELRQCVDDLFRQYIARFPLGQQG